MQITQDRSDPYSGPPPFDPQNRDRIERVASEVLALCGRLEARLTALEKHVAEVEDLLEQAGVGGR